MFFIIIYLAILFIYIEYESNFIINKKKTNDLVVLIQQLIQGASSYLSSYYKQRMNYIVDNIKIIVYQFVLILYYSLIIIFSLRKNEEMMKERKMLDIIPKNELEQILIKEDIRI